MKKTLEQGMEQGSMERPGHKRKLFSKNARRAACVGIGAAVVVWVYGMLYFYQLQYPWLQGVCSWLRFTAGCSCVLVPAVWALILFMKPVEKAADKVKKAAGAYWFSIKHMRSHMAAGHSSHHSVIACIRPRRIPVPARAHIGATQGRHSQTREGTAQTTAQVQETNRPNTDTP